jgi:hypothetical protein
MNRLGAGASNAREQQFRDMLMKLLSPESLGNESNAIFDILKRSPMYSTLMAQAIGGTNSLSNSLSSSFARRGLGTSGIAAVAQPLAASSFGNTMMGINSDLFMKAMSLARENLNSRADYLSKAGPITSVGAGTLGRTLSDMTPQIYDWLKGLNYGKRVSAPGTYNVGDNIGNF